MEIQNVIETFENAQPKSFITNFYSKPYVIIPYLITCILFSVASFIIQIVLLGIIQNNNILISSLIGDNQGGIITYIVLFMANAMIYLLVLFFGNFCKFQI